MIGRTKGVSLCLTHDAPFFLWGYLLNKRSRCEALKRERGEGEILLVVWNAFIPPFL